jgi:hypothetical protein
MVRSFIALTLVLIAAALILMLFAGAAPSSVQASLISYKVGVAKVVAHKLTPDPLKGETLYLNPKTAASQAEQRHTNE